MPNPPTEPLDYATPTPTPAPERGGAPRWLILAGVALGAALLLLLVISVLTSPEPALAAQYLALRFSYEITAVALYAAAYVVVRRLGRRAERRLSYLAVLAFLSVVLTTPHIFPRATRWLPWIGSGLGVTGLVVGPLLAVVAGVVAVVRIGRSRGALTGIPWAVAGAIGGTLWVAWWAYIYLSLVFGMARWR